MCLPSVLACLKLYSCILPCSTPRQTVARVPTAASSSSRAPSVIGWMGNTLCLVSTCSKSPGVPAHTHPCRAAVQINSENQNLLNWEGTRGIIRTNFCAWEHCWNSAGDLAALGLWSFPGVPVECPTTSGYGLLLLPSSLVLSEGSGQPDTVMDHCWNESFFHKLALIQISVQCSVFVHKSLCQCRRHRWMEGFLSSPLSAEFWTVILWNCIC